MIKDKAGSCLQSGTVDRVSSAGRRASSSTIPTPAVFTTPKSSRRTSSRAAFCGSQSLSKYLIQECRKDGKVVGVLEAVRHL